MGHKQHERQNASFIFSCIKQEHIPKLSKKKRENKFNERSHLSHSHYHLKKQVPEPIYLPVHHFLQKSEEKDDSGISTKGLKLFPSPYFAGSLFSSLYSIFRWLTQSSPNQLSLSQPHIHGFHSFLATTKRRVLNNIREEVFILITKTPREAAPFHGAIKEQPGASLPPVLYLHCYHLLNSMW